MSVTRVVVSLAVLVVSAACSSQPALPPRPPSATATNDRCVTVVDKVFGVLARMGHEVESDRRGPAIEECRTRPSDDPMVACVLAAEDDAAVERCMMAPKGEPVDQLAAMTENLRTYFFVHETFTDQRVALTPATPCCQYPTKKCPAETAPNEILGELLGLDLSTERAFQYRFESTSNKAVVWAVGDRDCDGKVVTYRRELEWRADGNMHITVDDPPAGRD